VEHLASLRAIPNMVVLRPCDANETAAAWRWVMEYREGPAALVLSRQKLPVLDRSQLAPASELARGAYVLSEPRDAKPVAVIIATGAEVHPALEAQRMLAARRIPVRVVSMPSWELFARQEADYREHVLPPQMTARVAVEAAVPFGWERWVGTRGRVIGINRFGASAPGEVNLERFGFTPTHIARAVEEVLQS
jgi:transketolase